MEEESASSEWINSPYLAKVSSSAHVPTSASKGAMSEQDLSTEERNRVPPSCFSVVLQLIKAPRRWAGWWTAKIDNGGYDRRP